MNRTLLKKEWRSNWKILLIFCLVLTLYTSMIISMFDPKLGDSLKLMMESMPQLFSMFGMDAPGATLLEFMTNYLYGFLYVVFPMVFFIILANKLMIRYTDRGTFACLLATPNSRRKIALTQALTMLLLLFLLAVYVTVVAVVSAQIMFPGELKIVRLLGINVGLYGLWIFLSGVCFLAACIFNDGGKALAVGAGLNILFLLIQMISQAGEKFEKLKYATPLTMFQADRLASGEKEAVLLVVCLYGSGILFYLAGIAVFTKKDLSV